MTKSSRFLSRCGFTLVEMMAVLAIMAILAAAGATGVVHMVPAYQQRACDEERTQAVRAFISYWLENRPPAKDQQEMDDAAKKWLTAYLNKNQVNCGNAAVKEKGWEIQITPSTDVSGSYTVSILCKTHGGEASSASASFGISAASSGGIGWDNGFSPSDTPSGEAP